MDRVEQMLLAGRPSPVALPEAGASAGGRQLVVLGLMGPRCVSVPAPRPASEDLVALASAVGVLA